MLYRACPGIPGRKTVAKLTALLFALVLVLQPAAVSAATADTYNIANTNAAGVSNNRVAQFNVGTNGLVLVNSASAVTSQLLGGTVAGNANLTNGPARVILFQVTGTGASALNGTTEIAGQKAAFILANPNGIAIGGAKFINAGRVVLTTGTPKLNYYGGIDSFMVQGGQITVDGNSDLTGADRIDLISRTIAVNATLNAKELNLVAGANKVNYDTLAAKKIDGTGTAPTVGIDVSALGGMYADKITLVATEKGAGVNSAGVIKATGGDIKIDSKGKVTLTNSLTEASGAITIVGQTVDLSGVTMNADGDINLKATGGNVTSTDFGAVYSGGKIAVDATGNFVNNQFSSIYATGAFAINANAVYNNDNGALSSGGDFTIALGFSGYPGGYKCSGGTTPVTSGPVTLNNNDGFIDAGGNLAIAVRTKPVSATTTPVYAVDNARGMMSAGNDLTIAVTATSNGNGKCGTPSVGNVYAVNNSEYGMMSAGRNLVIVAKEGSLYNCSGGKCGSSNYYHPSSTARTNFLVNNTGGYMSANNDVSITVQGATTTTYRFGASRCSSGGGHNNCTPTTTAQLTVDNTDGYISAGNNLTVDTKGIVSNAGGTMTATNTAITANEVQNAAGTINGDTSVTIKTNKVFDTTAGTVTGGTITITQI